jgi:uncharacterized protein YndB with AHSA1/START domain
MTGPDGDHSPGFWEWVSVEAPHRFTVRDGFAEDDNGTASAIMPTMTMDFEFTDTGTEDAPGSRVTTVTSFNSLEELEKLTAMGMIEGTRAAMGQIEAVLADPASFAAGNGTGLQRIGETQARVSRVICGSVDQVWRAHTEAELLQRWQLGPDGWSMPVCQAGTSVGDIYRSEWRNDATGEQFALTGAKSPRTLNEMTLTPVGDGTLLSYLITYPDADIREQVLATGMVDGMESSYARLEQEVLA